MTSPGSTSQRPSYALPGFLSRFRAVAALVTTAAAMLLASAPLKGQATPTGELMGRVVDGNGAPVPGVTLTLEAAPQGAPPAAPAVAARPATTDAAGTFRFPAVPTGGYHLRAQRVGYRAAVVTDVVVRARQTTEARVTLVAAAAELAPVVVAAPSVTIRREDTELGTVIGSEEISRLPVGLDARSIVAFTPGARREAVWGGASAQANNYQLDGLALNHPGVGGQLLEPNVTWIEALEVKGLGAGAGLGNFQGGVVNVVTKSGSNERRATLRANVETHHLNDSNVGVSEAVPEVAARREIDAEASGPIVRDRLFYYGSAQLVTRDLRVPDQLGGGERFTPGYDARRDLRLFGKVTWQPSTADLLSVTAIHASAAGENAGLTGFESLEATHRLRAPATLASLAWQRRGERQALEVKVSGTRADERLTPYGGLAVPGISTFQLVDDRRFQNAPFDEERRARSLAASATWRVDVATGGVAHTIEVGGEHAAGTWLDRRTRTGGFTWRPSAANRRADDLFLPHDPATWDVAGIIPVETGGGIRLDAATRSSALFVQDHVTLSPRLSVSPGLRVGRWEGALQRADGSGRFTAVRDVAVDPRIGLTVDLTGRNELVAKAHWGRYHQGLFGQLFDRAEGSAVFESERTWYHDGPVPADPRRAFTDAEWAQLEADGRLRLVEERVRNETGPVEGYRQPYVDQWVLGIERTFGANWKVEARYVNRRNRDMVALVDRNQATNHSRFTNVMVLDRFGGALRGVNGDTLRLTELWVPNSHILQFLREKAAGMHLNTGMPGFVPADTARLSWSPDYALTTAPDARRRFDQLQLAVSTRAARWDVTGSVAVTRLEGNVASVTGYGDERTRGAGPFVRANERVNFHGTLDEASGLEIKLLGSGELPWWGLRGGVFYTFRSGDRVTPTLTVSGILLDLVPDMGPGAGASPIPTVVARGLSGEQMFVEQRGLYRYPSRSLLDLHLERGFVIRGAELVLAVDVFNLFGEDAVTRVNTRLDASTDPFATSAYGSPRAREAPRTLRLGTALRF